MNHLVTLEPRAGELEKILSGVKCMVVKEFDPAQSTVQPVSPGDTLYFLRDKDECDLRVTATVVRILLVPKSLDEDLSHILKEMQPRLQLTEDQYNHWSAKKRLIMVEFDCAQKISVIHIATDEIADRSDWIPFEEFSRIT
jgi:hypothetical protein